MKKTLFLLIIPFLFFGQEITFLVDEDFNGFMPTNFNIDTDYGSWPGDGWNLDDWPYEWRIETSMNLFQSDNYTNGTPFIMGGNPDGAVTFSPNPPITMFTLPTINTTEYDSVKLSFESCSQLAQMFTSGSVVSYNAIEISNNNEDWYTIWSLEEDPVEYLSIVQDNYIIDISSFEAEDIYIKFTQFGVNSWAVDNIQVIGYSQRLGCTDTTACNYDELATEDDNSCIYPEEFYDCNGNCLSDLDMDSICDDLDNCPEEYNPNQEDFNSDDIGDACDGVVLDEEAINRKLIKAFDVLGRAANSNKGFNIELYDDGSVEKRYKID